MFEWVQPILHYNIYLPILKTTTFKAIYRASQRLFLSDDDNASTDGELTDTAGKCRTVTTTVVNEGAG